MNRYLQYFLICFLIVLTNFFYGQEDTLALDSLSVYPVDEDYNYNPRWEDIGEWDSLSYEYSKIPEDHIDEYRENPNFRYKRKGVENGRSGQNNFLSNFINSLIRLLERLFDFNMPPTVKILIEYILGFGLLILIIYIISKLTGFELNFNYKKKQKQKLEDLSFETIEENLEEINFDELLEQAIKERQYRIAIRLFFLKNLQQLSNNEKIIWSIDKTNNDYKYELSSTSLLPGFDQTVYLFEYIWYGNFDLSEFEFQKALNTFRNFQNQIIREQ